MMKISIVLAMFVCVFVCGSAYGAAYSTGFEGETPLDGWTVTGAVTIRTDIVHSGEQAVQVDTFTDGALRQALSYPISNYGTLEVWVYDFGILAARSGSVYGPRWGVAKGGQLAGGTIIEKTFLNNANGYGASSGNNGEGNASWFSPKFQGGIAGRNGEPLSASWTKWTIKHREATEMIITVANDDGSVEIEQDFGAEFDVNDAILTSIQLNGGKSDGFSPGAIFDDLEWIPIPEPGAFSLLVVSGLLLACRR